MSCLLTSKNKFCYSKEWLKQIMMNKTQEFFNQLFFQFNSKKNNVINVDILKKIKSIVDSKQFNFPINFDVFDDKYLSNLNSDKKRGYRNIFISLANKKLFKQYDEENDGLFEFMLDSPEVTKTTRIKLLDNNRQLLGEQKYNELSKKYINI